jgi:hypothetical protein
MSMRMEAGMTTLKDLNSMGSILCYAAARLHSSKSSQIDYSERKSPCVIIPIAPYFITPWHASPLKMMR